MAANTIALPEALALLDGPHAAVVNEIGSAGYTLWLGSGISRGRVIGLSGSDGVIAKLIEFLRAKRTAAADCKFNQALETLLTLAELDVAQRAALDLTVPVNEWPADQLKPIVGRLWNKYSEVLSIDIEGEKQDFLLWTGLDFPNTFADQDPDLEHLALAILVLEGVAPQLATANWDGLIEGAIVELGYPKEHLAITVTGDDLRNAAGAAAKLYKFHGCALRAIENEAIYRPLLIARSGQIGRWKYENAFTIVRQQLGALIQTTRTLMIGLSGQDENIRDMFQKVGGDKPWPWKEPPAVVFSNDALTQDQKDILEGIYSADEWSASRTDICTSSLIESYGRPLLPAIVLHILTQKLQVLASDAAAPNLGPGDRERLDNGIVHLRDKAAEAGQSDLLVLMRHVAAAVARVRHQVEIGESPAGRLKYFPMSGDPVPRMKDAIGLKSTGQREAATALGVIGDVASTGDWTIGLDNPEEATSGALRIETDGAAARVFFAANDHVINGLLEAGAFNESDPDVVVVSAAPLRTRQTRSPSGVYRNAKPQARFIEFGPMLAKAANTDDLVRSFRWEAAL